MREVFRNPDIRRVELAFVGFNVAETGTWVAILVYAYDVGGAPAVGAIALVQLVPAAIFAPFASLLGDRYRRERVLLVGYVVQSAAMAATGAALLAGAPAALTFALAAVAATSITLTRPTQGAILPQLARSPEELTASNVASTMIEGTSVLVGPALAGAVLQFTSPGVVFWMMACWLAISAALASRIDMTSQTPRGARPFSTGILSESVRGFSTLAAEPNPRVLIALGGAHTIVWGALDVLLVLVAIDLLEIGESGVGYLNSALGAGGLLGAMAAVTLVGRRRLAPALAVGIALWGLPITALGVTRGPLLAFLLLPLVGAGHSIMDAAGRTLLQRAVSDDLRCRMFGVLEGFIMGGLAVGSILAPVLVGGLGVEGALVATGLFLPLLGLITWRLLRRTDTVVALPAERVRLLRSIPMFGVLSAPRLEGLCFELEEVSVPAGVEVMRQGDVGDRFYVIAEGQLDVFIDDSFVRSLGPGDFFGEIALLRNVLRTATVRAVVPARLFGLGREKFLEVMTASPRSAAAANEVAAAHLSGEESSAPPSN